MKEKLLVLIEKFKKEYDFESELYLTYTGQSDDSELYEWDNNHFEDTLDMGYTLGQTALAEEMISKLEKIVGEI